MKNGSKIILLLVCLVVCFVVLTAPLQSQRKSLEKKPSGPGAMIKESDLNYQLWEGFLLVRKANAGEPAAQHELGIRYLQGKGFEADTVKAVLWFLKAADQGFELANFNLGIFAMNGWGMPWNPFQSFGYFKEAGKKNMPEADFVVGLILTENLVVPQDWTEARDYIQKAAVAGFGPAKKALVEFDRRENVDSVRQVKQPASGPKNKPIFLDFDLDTATQINEQTLLNELAREAGPDLRSALGVVENKEPVIVRDTTAMALIERAAEAGSPEALTLLGRFYEKGIGVPRDAIRASAYYVRGMRLESGRARELLWNLIREPGYAENLERLSKAPDPAAQFVWAGIVGARFDQRLSGEQAFNLLQMSANENYVDAVIEMGLCYQSGRWTKQDRAKASELWQKASAMGSQEAATRLAAMKLFANEPSEDLAPIIRFMEIEAGEGSILAEVALALCYETGRGVRQQKGEAARLYRNAAQRGSQSAYDALRRMHDEIRPPGKEFEISD